MAMPSGPLMRANSHIRSATTTRGSQYGRLASTATARERDRHNHTGIYGADRPDSPDCHANPPGAPASVLPGMDYVVIGAGPAGLQLAYLLQRAGRDYVVLEAGPTPGTFYRTFPRHRRMISINKPHTGWHDPEKDLRVDWNSLLSDDPGLRFTRYTDRYFPHADDYVRYLADFARGLNVRYGCRVTRAGPAASTAGPATTARSFDARRVVVATGFGAMNVPPIPGIETTERYGDMPVDPDDFTDQRVLIIGKGNSAFETADNLTERAAVIHVAGPRSIKFAWRTHFIGHLRAVNNNFLDTYQLKTQNMVLDGDILRIERAAGRLPDHVRVRPAGQGRPARLRPGDHLHRVPDGRVDLRRRLPARADDQRPVSRR